MNVLEKMKQKLERESKAEIIEEEVRKNIMGKDGGRKFYLVVVLLADQSLMYSADEHSESICEFGHEVASYWELYEAENKVLALQEKLKMPVFVVKVKNEFTSKLVDVTE